MTVGTNTLYFSYDAVGTPMSVNFNGTEYFYTTNLQGDVTGIVNSSGVTVVTYTYDAWGNRPGTSTFATYTAVSVYNPLRYRGYVYDRETGLYYLQSRYYNPAIGRFINADEFASTGQGLLGNNMFAYCGNNPVSRADNKGNIWILSALVKVAVGAAKAVVTEVVTSVITGKEITWTNVAGAAAGGATSGLLKSFGVPPVVADAAGAAVSAATTGWINGDDAETVNKAAAEAAMFSIISDEACGLAGKYVRNFLDGNVTGSKPKGGIFDRLRELTYKGKYVNEDAPSTVVSEAISDFLKEIPIEIFGKAVKG